MSDGRLRPFFWLFVLFLAQIALFPALLQNTPPLVLIGVVFCGLSFGPLYGLVAGACAGLFFEIFGLGRFGFQMGVLGGVGALAGALSSKIFRESAWTQLLLPPVCNYLVTALGLFFYQSALWQETSFWAAVGSAFAWTPLFSTLIFSPLVFRFLRKVSPARRQRLPVWR